MSSRSKETGLPSKTSSTRLDTRRQPTPKSRYRLMFLPQALEEYRALDGGVQTIIKKLLAKRLDEPRVPGGALHGDLAGCYKIKLLKQGVRLVFRVQDDQLIVLVLAIDKREDGAAYSENRSQSPVTLGVSTKEVASFIRTARGPAALMI